MIDTHAHIYDESFENDIHLILETASQNGIFEIWMPNCNSETYPRMLAIEAIDPEKYKPMIGLHPCYVDANYQEELDFMAKETEKRKFILVGEIGLDFYWDLQFIAQQEQAFLAQLELAKSLQIPVCIHSRNSKDNTHNAIIRCCELIKEHNFQDVGGIFHCFSGNKEEALRVIDLGFHLGIGGVVTFKNGGIYEYISQMPLDRLVLETDAPYLAPVPHRGKRNEPSYIPIIAEKLGNAFGKSKEYMAEVTCQNAKKLVHNVA
ncbi:MAG: TatD family hydrolase [Leadbetterella sp.]